MPSWKKELLPEEETERGEGCMPPLNARNELSLLGFLREFQNEVSPPTRLQSQPSGASNTPAGAEDPDPPAVEEAPNQVEDQNMSGGAGEETQGLHNTHHQPAEAQAKVQTRAVKPLMCHPRAPPQARARQAQAQTKAQAQARARPTREKARAVAWEKGNRIRLWRPSQPRPCRPYRQLQLHRGLPDMSKLPAQQDRARVVSTGAQARGIFA